MRGRNEKQANWNGDFALLGLETCPKIFLGLWKLRLRTKLAMSKTNSDIYLSPPID